MQNTLILNLPISIVRPLILRRKFNLKLFYILTFLSIFSLLVFYIFQINSIIQKTYLLQNYEKELTKLQEENQNLEINFAKSNSLENLESLVQNLNYEKVEKIRYIQVLGGQVVTK